MIDSFSWFQLLLAIKNNFENLFYLFIRNTVV